MQKFFNVFDECRKCLCQAFYEGRRLWVYFKRSATGRNNKAIKIILSGKKYISDSFAEKLAEDTFSGKSGNPFNQLSPREFEIVSLLLDGKTVTDISHALNIQTSTVGTHKARLFEKLGVTNLLELKELATTNNL